jgi:hypothetical protein
MRVIAVETGFYKGQLRQPCELFDFAEADMAKGKDGKPKLPSWVYPIRGVGEQADERARIYVRGLMRMQERDFLEGAIAASAPGAKLKVHGGFVDAMNSLQEPKHE